MIRMNLMRNELKLSIMSFKKANLNAIKFFSKQKNVGHSSLKWNGKA